MERKKLTAEELQKAETYIPLAKKYAIVQVLAPGCIERMESGFWRENAIGRRLVELYILTGFYLHLVDTSGLDKEKPEFQFTLDDYDQLSGAARELREIDDELAEEIKRDVQDMNDLLDNEVTAQLAEKNDLLNRLEERLRMGMTPELAQQFQQAVENAKAVADGKDEAD